MSIQLTAVDVIDLAVQTEVRGEAFYRQAAAKADRAEARELFAHLAEEEMRHKQLFEGFASDVTADGDSTIDWDEAMAYIRATVDHEYFTPAGSIQAIPLAETVDGMVKQAIGFEKQTLLFFLGLRDLVRSSAKPVVEKIMDEEKAHIRRLARMLS